MKTFAIKAFIFLMPLLALAFIWEHGLGKVQNSYSKKRQQLENKLADVEVLFLGASQVENGINPAVFRLKTYNAANAIQSLYYDKAITLKYIDKMPKLKYVFISITGFSLWFQLGQAEHNLRDYYYRQFWDLQDSSFRWYDLNAYSKIMLYSPVTAFQYALQGFHLDLAPEIDSNGWTPHKVPFNKAKLSDSAAVSRVVAHEALCHDKDFTANIYYLESLLTTLNMHHVNAVFFTNPVSDAYAMHFSQRRMAITDSVIAGLSHKYGCKYLNYWKDKRFIDTDFGDVVHLNYEGAMKFSKLLDTEALNDLTGSNNSITCLP